MELQKTFLIIGIIIVIVIIVNLGILSYAKRQGVQMKMLTRVYQRAKNPWKEENEKMKELAEQVALYKERNQPDEVEERNQQGNQGN